MNIEDAKAEIEAFFSDQYVDEEDNARIASHGELEQLKAEDVERLAAELFTESEKIGIDPSALVAKRIPLGDEIIDDGVPRESEAISISPDEALSLLSKDNTAEPECSLRTFSNRELSALQSEGRVTRLNIFDESCADRMPEEIDRLITADIIPPARGRTAPDGTPTEWIVSLGHVWDAQGDESRVLAESKHFSALYAAMMAFAESYNKTLENAAGDEIPLAVAPDGIELNINCVLGAPAAQWSGLHQHVDMKRFTDGLAALPEDSIRHNAVRARALTVSVYFRRECHRNHSPGGALTFVTPKHARGSGDRNVFDIVLADHNTGAIFLPGTVHGVARMPRESDIRYSAQAFFPERTAWESEIKPRIESGEIKSELEQSGTSGWR